MSVMRTVSTRELFHFTAGRYLVYSLQLIRGVLIAGALGPYYLGIWGFLMLVQQYLSYSSLGLQYAVNVELSTGSQTDDERKSLIIGGSFATVTVISGVLLVAGIGIPLLTPALFSKYEFTTFVFAISLLTILSNYQQLFINCFRVYGRLNLIILTEIFAAAVLLLLPLLFKQQQLLTALLIGLVLTQITTLSVFSLKSNFPFQFTLRPSLRLIALGLPLLVYNVTFYLITDTGRIAVSALFPVEVMGYYSLANTITNATLLGLSSVAWVVFPNLLARLQYGESKEVVESTLHMMNDLYIPSVFLLVFSAILLSPILFVLLPQYEPTKSTLAILLLAQAILSISFAFNSLAIARNKQMMVAGVSIVAIIVVAILCLVVGFLGLDFVWISLAVLVGSAVFAVAQTAVAIHLLEGHANRLKLVRGAFGILDMMAVFCFVFGSLQNQMLWWLVGFGIFLISNRAKLSKLINFLQVRLGR